MTGRPAGDDMAEVIQFNRRSYSAKLLVLEASALRFTISGTLCGHLDFCIQESNGQSGTYTLTSADACRLIAALHAVVGDIQTHCLFERDPLLMPD
jgi:hypothetical protein